VVIENYKNIIYRMPKQSKRKKCGNDCDIVTDVCDVNQCRKKHCNCCKPNQRNFLNKSAKMRCKLGKIQQHCKVSMFYDNPEERKYRNYAYNGLFTKGLQHNSSNGQLNST